MSIQEKVSQPKDTQAQLTERTNDLMDSGEFALDADFDDEETMDLSVDTIPKGKFSSTHRKKLEDYLDECRLQREIGDDFDL